MNKFTPFKATSAVIWVALLSLTLNVMGLVPEKLYEMVSPQVVVIETFDEWGQSMSQGSGVILGKSQCIHTNLWEAGDRDGTDLLSNFHVISYANQIVVKTKSGKRVEAAVIHFDSDRDLAILRTLESIIDNSNRVVLGKAPRIGQKIYSLGAPHGLGWTFGDGMISGVRQIEGMKVIQFTAPISPGSSGGGLFDEDGCLLGLPTAQIKDGQNLNFAVCTDSESLASIQKLRAGHSLLPAKSVRPTVEPEDWAVGFFISDNWEVSEKRKNSKWELWYGTYEEAIIGVSGCKSLSEKFKKYPAEYLSFEKAVDSVRSKIEIARSRDFPRDLEGLMRAVIEKGTLPGRMEMLQKVPPELSNQWVVLKTKLDTFIQFKQKEQSATMMRKILRLIPNKPSAVGLLRKNGR